MQADEMKAPDDDVTTGRGRGTLPSGVRSAWLQRANFNYHRSASKHHNAISPFMMQLLLQMSMITDHQV